MNKKALSHTARFSCAQNKSLYSIFDLKINTILFEQPARAYTYTVKFPTGHEARPKHTSFSDKLIAEPTSVTLCTLQVECQLLTVDKKYCSRKILDTLTYTYSIAANDKSSYLKLTVNSVISIRGMPIILT